MAPSSSSSLSAAIPPSFHHMTTTPKTKTETATTLHYSSSSSSDSCDEDDDDGVDRFHNVKISGVSVSPQGFLVLLQSDVNSSTFDRGDDNNDDTDDNPRTPTSCLAFPILLTVGAQDDYTLSSSSAYIKDKYINVDDATIDDDDNDENEIDAPKLPELFQLNKNMDQTSVSSPEALTYLQLLNGVDMATPVLPPDILSLICVWYAFLLLEEKEEGIDESRGSADAGGLNNDSLVVVEDELGLNDSNNDINAVATKSKYRCSNEDALDYIRAMVRTTLPPDKKNPMGSGNNGATSFLEASPGQRSKVQLPRVWLRGVRLQEVVMMGEKDEVADKRSNTTNTAGDALLTTIGRVPIQFTLLCSVDDGSKMLDIPLFAIPMTEGWEKSTPELAQHKFAARLGEISHEILQELSHSYNVETSASFLSLALFQRYGNKSSSGRGGSLNSRSSVPTLQVSNGLLKKLTEMQQRQDAITGDNGSTGRTRYCWVLPTLDEKTKKNNDVNNNIDEVILCQGVPFYRPLSQIQEEGQRGVLKPSASSDDTGGDASDNESRRRKTKPLTLEQQATQQKLISAWKIASQRNDAGALERIQKAMEDLEKEVTYEDGGSVDELEETTLKIIQRAMQLNSPPGDGGILPQDEEVVGLIYDLEEATMNSSAGDYNVETGNDER